MNKKEFKENKKHLLKLRKYHLDNNIEVDLFTYTNLYNFSKDQVVNIFKQYKLI